MERHIKSPHECSESELTTLEKLIIDGGEVMTNGLRNRIKLAERLIFLLEGECVAVGAIKNPSDQYKADVFKKSGVPSSQSKYKYELGWLYVIPSARKKGLGHLLIESALKFVGSSGCFATTRANNDSIHHLFSQYSFSKLGIEYQSVNGDYSLMLYVNKP
jgi:GNAT superfamily N-acetyltransferase